MTLAELDVQILHMIELEPTISVKEIANRVGTSWITANRHIEQLRKLGILSNAYAVFDPNNLGLERHIVLFDASTEKQVEALETACDVHPYTHYRTRIYGPFTGLFTQFDIPTAGYTNFSNFLDGLRQLELCREISDMKSTGYRTSTHTNLELFDAKTISWNYNWDNWSRAIEKSSSTLPEIAFNKKAPDLNPVDLRILRELTSNANISQGELQKKYSISQSTVSRKMIAITERYIESVRAQIDRSKFDVTSTKLFYSTDTDEDTRNKIFNAFHASNAPPFPLSVDLLENDEITIWGRMPPSHEHKLYYMLWKYLPELQVFTMDTVGNHSTLYWFYPENYNSKVGGWKIDYEWLVAGPLQEIEQKLN